MYCVCGRQPLNLRQRSDNTRAVCAPPPRWCRCRSSASRRQRKTGVRPTTVVLAARTHRHRINFHPNHKTRQRLDKSKQMAREARRQAERQRQRQQRHKHRHRKSKHATKDKAHKSRRRALSTASDEAPRETGPEIPKPVPEATVRMCKFRHVDGCTVCKDLYNHFTLPDGTQVRHCVYVCVVGT